MTPLGVDEVRELLPAYAAGALEREEMDAVDALLAEHPELRRELASYEDALAQAIAGESVAPPPALRDRFLDRISGSPVLQVERGVAQSVVSSAPASPKSSQRGLVLPGALVLALAASLFLLVRANEQKSVLQAALARRDSVLARTASDLAKRDSTLNMLLGAEQAVLVVNMGPQNAGPGIQFFWNVKEGRALLRAYHLPPAPAGRTYQLWVIKDGKPLPMQLFNSDASGRMVMAGLEMPTSTQGITAVAVTEEPAGGSMAPTTQPILVGNVRTVE